MMRTINNPAYEGQRKELRNRINQSRRGPPISYRLVIGVLGFIFCLLPFCLSFFQIADLDVCMVERFPNRINKPEIVNQSINQSISKSSIAASVTLQDELVDASDFLTDLIVDPIDTIGPPINQSINQSNKKFRPRSQSTSIMVILLITCCLIKAFLPVPHDQPKSTNQLSSQFNHHHTINEKMPFLHAFKVLLAYLWYLAAYFLCNALKGFIGDDTCNVHANSISGHYLFHFYAGLALFHLHAQQTQSVNQSICSMQFWRRLLKNNEAKFFMFFFLCYCLSSFIILMNTYLHGYHSMRQILYGIAMAMFAHWIMMDVLDMIDDLISAHIEKTYNGKSINQSNQPSRTASPLTASGQLKKRTLLVDDPSASPLQSINQSISQSTSNSRQFTHFSPFQRFLYWMFYRSLRVSEERGIFFIFPFLIVLVFQLISFGALLLSPAASMWKSVDLIVLALSWCLLLVIYVKYLKLPMSAHSPTRQAHKHVGSVAVMSLEADNQA